MKKRILVATIVFVALNGLLFAQAKTSLLVRCDQSGAGVYLNDSLIGYTSPNYSALIFPGQYTIRVSKSGFPEFKTTVIVGNSPITILATLGTAMSPGGTQLPPPQLYQQGALAQLRVDSNVSGAKVFLNEAFAGETPFVSFLNPGIYAIVIRLEGYEDYRNTVMLNGFYQLHAKLAFKYRFVDYEIKIPEYFTANGGRPAKFSDVEIYLDGKRIQSAFGKTTPGTHRLTLVSRNLRLENDFELAPGRFASIELFLGISVR
ncbi:MAG: PEGA domain-containing protein [Spirochaetia bacterium]|jgi:hypothetical protein|nr:PEGA domain-containing protein [Spirochaetia bacterium]